MQFLDYNSQQIIAEDGPIEEKEEEGNREDEGRDHSVAQRNGHHAQHGDAHLRTAHTAGVGRSFSERAARACGPILPSLVSPPSAQLCANSLTRIEACPALAPLTHLVAEPAGGGRALRCAVARGARLCGRQGGSRGEGKA